MPDDAEKGHFFRALDPTTGGLDRVVWDGPIDLAFIRLLHDVVGDVPAPLWGESRAGATPREMLGAQFVKKPNVVGPFAVRHLRAMADWRRPMTWPLLAAVHAGRAADLYYAKFVVVPAGSSPTPEQTDCVAGFWGWDWSAWCRSADALGFIGSATVEGYAPYLLVFGTDASRRLLADGCVEVDPRPPGWLRDAFHPPGPVPPFAVHG